MKKYNISLGNSLYQCKKTLKLCATNGRAVRQAILERAKSYDALKHNWYKSRKAKLESEILKDEAKNLQGAEKELKLLDAEEKINSETINFDQLIIDSINQYYFYDNFLNEIGDISLKEFENQEEEYFKCKKLLDFCDKKGVELGFDEKNLQDPVVKQIHDHYEKVESYSKNFMENILPTLDSNPDKILLLESE